MGKQTGAYGRKKNFKYILQEKFPEIKKTQGSDSKQKWLKPMCTKAYPSEFTDTQK